MCRALFALGWLPEILSLISARMSVITRCAARSLVGPRGRVFAFEADPNNFERLADHLRTVFVGHRGDRNAVSSTTGNGHLRTLVSTRRIRMGHGDDGSRPRQRRSTFSVDTISLDDWSQQNGIENVSVMKVDAEGSEVSILRARGTFCSERNPRSSSKQTTWCSARPTPPRWNSRACCAPTNTTYSSSRRDPCACFPPTRLPKPSTCSPSRQNAPRPLWRF